MRVYHLKVTLPGLKGVHRVIEATENCTFDDLHETIFRAFDRDDEHLYSFFITKTETKNVRKIYDAPEVTHPMALDDSFGFDEKKPSAAKVRLAQADLEAKDVFYYLFDFGDEWWHRIRVERITETTGKKKSIKIAKLVGASPPQYEDYDEEDE